MMLHVSGTAPAKAKGRVSCIRPYDKADGKSKKNSPLRHALPEPVRRAAPVLRAQCSRRSCGGQDIAPLFRSAALPPQEPALPCGTVRPADEAH